MELENRVSIVTGAAAGIGRATALALAQEKARAVVLVDIDETGLAETASEVEAAGAKALIAPTDVTSVAAMQDLFARVEKDFGRLDILHNNAGLTTGTPSFPDCSIGIVAAMADVNLKGVMIGTRLGIDAITRAGGGAIVNTASVAGLAPSLNEAAYSATKAGVIMFTRSCAPLAESHGVRVNCVCPGIVDTPMLGKTGIDGQLAEYLQPIVGQIEILRPEEIAAAVLELIRDDSKAGEVVTVENRPKGS